MTPNRRQFLQGLAVAGAGVAAWPAFAGNETRKKVAFLGTEVRQHSHAQHFLDRMTLGYGWRGAWQMPRLDVASVYIEQFPDDDLGRGRI